MRKTFTRQQERIAIAALTAGHHVWRDDEPGEFGPTVDVRVGEPGNGSVIVFWCDGSVSISTSSRNLAGHTEAAERASQLAAELLAAAGTKEAA